MINTYIPGWFTHLRSSIPPKGIRGDIIHGMPRIVVYDAGKWPHNRVPIVQSMWCNYRVISLRADYVIDIWPEPGYEHGKEAAGIAAAWTLARGQGAAGLLLLGCDVAADPDDLAAMLTAALERPEDLHTGLVKLWPRSTGRDTWIWSHRGGTLNAPVVMHDLAATVAYVSLGFLWVPSRLLELAGPVMPGWQHGQADVALSELALEAGIAAHIVPDCQPKHLHFQGEHDGRYIQARAQAPANQVGQYQAP